MPAETVSDNVETLINLALAEDFGSGDVTSTYFVPEHLTARRWKFTCMTGKPWRPAPW